MELGPCYVFLFFRKWVQKWRIYIPREGSIYNWDIYAFMLALFYRERTLMESGIVLTRVFCILLYVESTQVTGQIDFKPLLVMT